MYNLKELFLNLTEGLKLFPVRYVDNRRKQSDIRFGVADYGKEESCYDNEHYKYVLSCLTKEKEPFYKEAEWRLFSKYEDIPIESPEKNLHWKLSQCALCLIIQDIVTMRKMKQINIGNERQGYERVYEYKGNYYTMTGIGTNGFIVSAYPIRKDDL